MSGGGLPRRYGAARNRAVIIPPVGAWRPGGPGGGNRIVNRGSGRLPSGLGVTMDQVVGASAGGVTGLLIVAVVGLVIGAVPKALMPGPDPGGWLVTILLGIAGSWVGSLRFGALGFANVGFVGAVFGAMLLLFVYRRLKGA